MRPRQRSQSLWRVAGARTAIAVNEQQPISEHCEWLRPVCATEHTRLIDAIDSGACLTRLTASAA